MPVAIVACQAGGFQRKDRSGQTLTHRSQQPAKAGALLQAASRTAHVIVDDHNLFESQLPCPVAQIILALLAFPVTAHLVSRRLPYVYISGPLEMLGFNLLVHGC